ncbi:MAG TPA: hypothetical protein VEC36_12225 [Patescibacteria group bacterium]|nr:hypothetical protein [Patescibacteria group bacterium]
MAVELNLGGKNYQYTPRHPYRETVVANGECAFKVEAPDGSVLCTIEGDSGNAAEKKIRRLTDLSQEEALALLRYGFFSPNGVQPVLSAEFVQTRPDTSAGFLKRLTMIFRREQRNTLSNV